MCAAPGGKTTHIAALMTGKVIDINLMELLHMLKSALFQGTVIALDRSATKIRQIEENAKKLGLQNIKALVFDSTKACSAAVLHSDEKEAVASPVLTPPFAGQLFDRILLDAPCSGMGQRPQLYNTMKYKEFLSFPKLQKKLFVTVNILSKLFFQFLLKVT